MKKFVLSLLCLMTFLFLGIAQAGQIDGLQYNDVPPIEDGKLGVFVNPGHIGDALIGGYYNARDAITQISLVNTSATKGVAVKVRFREGKFSNEVLDFYVCLTAGDRWTAWVTSDGNEDHPAKVYTYGVADDDTYTYPEFPSDGVDMAFGTPFACVTADMTKEGYFTIIGVQSWDDNIPGDNLPIRSSDACGEQLGIDGAIDENYTAVAAIGPVDTLAGTVNIWNWNLGYADYSYNMVALSNFRDGAMNQLTLAVDSPPTLRDSDTNGFQPQIDAVNFVLMKSNMIMFYDIRTWLNNGYGTPGAHSDVIITFPTKRTTLGTLAAQNPFQPIAIGNPITNPISECDWDNSEDYDYCEPVQFTLWDDEEHRCGCEETGFSPRTEECDDTIELCHEVNYIVIGDDDTDSILNTNLVDPDLNLYCDDPDYLFDIGWINFAFSWSGGLSTVPVNRVITLDATADISACGLPAVGYELSSIIEGFYGHMLELRYEAGCPDDE